MQAAAVTHDPSFQAKVNQAKATMGKIPVTQLILDREAEKKAKLQIALNPESPDFDPFVRLIALRSGLDQDQFVSATGRDQEIDHQVWLLIDEFFPSDTSNPSPGLWIWLKRCLLDDTIPTENMEAEAVAHSLAFQDKVRKARRTISKIPISELVLEQGQFSSTTTGLINAVEQAWLLIKEFFPLDTYGLPSLGMWAWLLRCLLGETVQEPTPEAFPLFLTYDPENILAISKLDALSQYCRKNGLDLEEFERDYQKVEDRIIEMLDQRWFIEVIPGTPLTKQVDRLRSLITDAFDTGGIDLDTHKIPNKFHDKLETIFVPRQFRGASLEEIQEAHPDENKDTGNISREYKEIVDKTSYEQVAPKPRGGGRPH